MPRERAAILLGRLLGPRVLPRNLVGKASIRARGWRTVGTHRAVCSLYPRAAVQKRASEREPAWLRASLVSWGCSRCESCFSPPVSGPSPSGSSCLFSHDIDGMDSPIVVKGGATRNSSSKVLLLGSEECFIGAERMSKWFLEKIVACLQHSFKYCRICAIARSRFCFTEGDHRKLVLWIVVTS